ncbi:tetratricopeptide repeat protein [Mucilaginibacter sp.]|uniref:tetratricopeptide repeat protein n=1 Tax=Mucilaginibacter sp. TaxID=1882438 RepID=UPI002605D11B|nr:tetratricopeptide repeat protein [Mucilaginibacter sp.]MDB4921913.1 hypothetical protein [Mucilaginibacter sp.]
MRFTLLIFICCMFCLSASAQWYNVLKSHKRFPLIEQVTDHSLSRIRISPVLKPGKVHNTTLDRSEYSFQAAENMVMRTAQHNMRFRVYNDASYNFSELAKLYIQQNRYSEAKWYLLQSNIISRQQNDDKHTIANLMELATIKSELGDYTQAQQDLTEAHDMAKVRGFNMDVTAIEKKMAFIKQNKNNTPKTDIRYAEAPVSNSKAE